MKLFFDISDILKFIKYSRSITGIQRATISIISGALRQTPGSLYISWKYHDEDTHLCCPAEDVIGALERFDTFEMARVFGVDVKGAVSRQTYLARFGKTPLKRLAQSVKLTAALLAGNTAFLKKRGINPLVSLTNPSGRDRAHAAPAQPLHKVADPGDALLALGAFYDHPAVVQSFMGLAGGGMRVYYLVHDLIPVLFPETTYKGIAQKYVNWLLDTESYATGLLANSTSTATDLADFLGANAVDLPIYTTPLAQTGLGDQSADDGLDLKELDGLSDAAREAATLPYALCVGTIEPRKNLWRLIQAWGRLAARPDIDVPRLVLAGRRGWLSKDVLALLDSGTLTHVTFVEAPKDHDLDYLYRNCQFTVTASLYEGWGLPVGEGLGYGKTGVVANVSSLPEVGGDMVHYCDPLSVNSIEAACLKLIETPEHRTALEDRIANTSLRSWDDVATDVLKAVAA